MALLRSADFPGDLGAINISLLRSEEMIFARASKAYRTLREAGGISFLLQRKAADWEKTSSDTY